MNATNIYGPKGNINVIQCYLVYINKEYKNDNFVE